MQKQSLAKPWRILADFALNMAFGILPF
jgi:hypothetical protein